MTTARERGWGNPDPGDVYRRDHIILVTAGNVHLYIRREIANLVKGFCDEIVAKGYRLDVNADDWGYNNRDIRGRPGVKSNHAWGLAIDLNSSKNPMTEDGHVHTDMPSWVPETAAKYGLFWGGHYSGSRKDPMHFEFLGSPEDVSKFPTGNSFIPAPHLPPTLEEDEEMFILNPVTDGNDTTQYWVNGNTRIPITADEAQQFRNSGFITKDMEPLAYTIFKQTNHEVPRP